MSNLDKELLIKAITTIYQNIDNPSLNLQIIATEVGISVSSLKRLFEKFMEQSPGAFIRKLRMELAFRTIKSKNESILEIALSSGFEDHSAFSRRFKETFGYSPVQGREKINIINELDSIKLEEPDMVELNPLKIQGITVSGLYYECAPKAWAQLSQKLTETELNDDFSGLFIGIGHDNPHEGNVAENQVRFTAGISFASVDLGIETITIEASRYARFRYVGKIWNIGLAYHYIYGQWLEKGRYQISHEHSTFMVFDKMPDGKKEERVIIYVPISDWSSLKT